MAHVRRGAATLAYLLSALPMGAIGFALVLGGWVTSLALLITPLIVPVLIVFRGLVGLLAGAEAWLARTLVGSSAQPSWEPDAGHGGYFRRGGQVLSDDAFYRRQGFFLVRHYAGMVVAIVELTLLTAGLGAIAFPAYHQWTHIDGHTATFAQSLLGIPAGIIVLVAGLALLRPLRTMSRSLADALLGERAAAPAPASSGPAPAEAPAHGPSDRQLLAMSGVTIGGISLLLFVIWAATGSDTFWPAWTMISLGAPWAFYAWIVALRERPDLPARLHMSRAMAIHSGLAVVVSLYLILIWAFSGSSDFWPIFPMLALFATLVAHQIYDINRSIRRGPLAERITELETTRAGAVNEQEVQLRRIERDLHDGAQARLVALGMSLGMAQQKLAGDDPEAAQALLADARLGAQEALQELRDLARGIHPPVLADRGLEAAVAALADRTPMRVTVAATIDERPPPAVETAAYFVVAEALTNAAKHARATTVAIAIGRVGSTLIVEITDDGVGGANGAGGGLTGLTRRVQALDGTLTVDSPAGGPTTIRAVMACAS